MQLSQWLKRANLSQKNFARLIAASPACISRLISGDLKPSTKMILKIEEATNGDVAFRDWKKQIAAKTTEPADGI